MHSKDKDSFDEAESQSSWDKNAALYAEKFLDPALYKTGYDALLSRLPKEARVLDAACGPGIMAHYFLKQRPDLRITGIDYAPAMVEQARHLVPAAQFEQGDLRSLPIPAQPYHAIVCGFGLPYLSGAEVREFLRYCRANLVANGQLYLSIVVEPGGETGFRTGSTGDRVWFNNHEPEALRADLANEGFQLTDTWTVHPDAENVRYEIMICRAPIGFFATL
ncbi:MAG TPA: class I SAM-dependent methyltransferase [Bacteroidia bacterium]|nr:class I SAM-dependent methyltransferase [Bacteroidia bacterium]